MATIVICTDRDRGCAAGPGRGKIRSMSPEELRERLDRAGLTPYRLSYLLGVEPNEGSKWTRGDRPVPKGRVAQIIELTDFVAEHGAAAVPLPALVRTANARPPLVRPAVTRPEPVVQPHSRSRDGRPSTPCAELRPETRAGFGPLHADFVRAHNLASQRGFER
jgi:DNA-binding transcriptional regulator YdaS (Cro superfamily)